MAAPPPSGKILPAGYAASYLKVMVDLLGRHGADAVLRRAGLVSWIGREEASVLSQAVDFAEASACLGGLEETVGARGARGLARRMGAAAFERVLRPVGAIAAMADPGFQSVAEDRRLRAGVYGLARTFGSMTSTAATTREDRGGLAFRLEPCPDCWGRRSTVPLCAAMLGQLAAAVAWIAPGVAVQVQETQCLAQGADACEFSLRWEAGG